MFNIDYHSHEFHIGTNIQFAEYHTTKDEYKHKNKEAIKRFSKKKILVLDDGISKIFNT